jgi:hypothetical protein
MEFSDLPRSSQMGLIYYHTVFAQPFDLEERYDSLSPIEMYSNSILDLNVYKNTSQKSIHAILRCITMTPLCSDLGIYDSWGFVLESNKKPMYIFQNKNKPIVNQVLIIKVDDILNDKRILLKEESSTNFWNPRNFFLLASAAYAFFVFSRTYIEV